MLNRCSGYVIVKLAAEPWLLTLFYFGSFCLVVCLCVCLLTTDNSRSYSICEKYNVPDGIRFRDHSNTSNPCPHMRFDCGRLWFTMYIGLRGTGSNVIICKTCSVLVFVLEQPNSVGPLSLRPGPVYICTGELLWFNFNSMSVYITWELFVDSYNPHVD